MPLLRHLTRCTKSSARQTRALKRSTTAIWLSVMSPYLGSVWPRARMTTSWALHWRNNVSALAHSHVLCRGFAAFSDTIQRIGIDLPALFLLYFIHGILFFFAYGRVITSWRIFIVIFFKIGRASCRESVCVYRCWMSF